MPGNCLPSDEEEKNNKNEKKAGGRLKYCVAVTITRVWKIGNGRNNFPKMA